jgi:hypothetical protein
MCTPVSKQSHIIQNTAQSNNLTICMFIMLLSLKETVYLIHNSERLQLVAEYHYRLYVFQINCTSSCKYSSCTEQLFTIHSNHKSMPLKHKRNCVILQCTTMPAPNHTGNWIQTRNFFTSFLIIMAGVTQVTVFCVSTSCTMLQHPPEPKSLILKKAPAGFSKMS